MYRTDLHTILVRALGRAAWTRSTRDEDNFRQVICSHLYEDISPNNTEIPSTRSSDGDIRVFGRKIEIKYVNAKKRDKLDDLLADIDLLLNSKVEFCVISVRFDHEERDAHLVRAVDLPLIPNSGATAPVSTHVNGGTTYYGPGIFLPACYTHANNRIPVSSGGRSKKTNSFISVEQSHNIERSCFFQVGTNLLHVDVIGSREDGLMTFLYKRADDLEFGPPSASHSITIPYAPAPLQVATLERGDVKTKPRMEGRAISVIERDVPCFRI